MIGSASLNKVQKDKPLDEVKKVAQITTKLSFEGTEKIEKELIRIKTLLIEVKELMKDLTGS